MELRRCLSLTASAERSKDVVSVRIAVRAAGVGHRVPTGFVDRNLVLVVHAADAKGKPVPLLGGPKLPAAAGQAVAGRGTTRPHSLSPPRP